MARPRRARVGVVQTRRPVTGLRGRPRRQQPRSFQPVTVPGPPGAYGQHPGTAPPSAGGAAAQPAPTQLGPDPTYLAQLARSQFERQTQIEQLQATGREDETDSQEAIRRLLSQVPEQRQQITYGANRAGLLYSGHLNKNLDEYQAQVTQQQGDLTTGLQRRKDARAAAIAALNQGGEIDLAEANAGLLERNTARGQDLAGMNALAAPPPVLSVPRARVRPARPRPSARGRAAPRPRRPRRRR